MARTNSSPDQPLSNADAASRAAEVAAYVADMAGELARLALDARLDLLAHFLTMARLEAEMAARRASDTAAL